MLLKLLAATILGFLCSRFWYEPLHDDSVPETFRYAAGVAAVAVAMPMFLDGERERHDAVAGALLAAVGVGAGVALNRVLRALDK